MLGENGSNGRVSRAFPLSYVIDGEYAALVGNASGIVLSLFILLGFTLLVLTLAAVTSAGIPMPRFCGASSNFAGDHCDLP